MRPLSHLSIRSKIIGIILLTNLVGMGIAFSLIINNDLSMFRRLMEERAQAAARLVRAYNIVPLLFDDPSDSNDSLQNLGAAGGLMEAYIFDGENAEFARLLDSGLLPDPPDPVAMDGGFKRGLEGGFLEVWDTVNDDGEIIGKVCLRYSTVELDRTVREYLLSMFWVLVAMILVSVTLSFLLGRIISRPILQLAEVTRRISARGDYSIRVSKIGSDEIATLCDVFNGMLEQIQARQEELKRSNRELDHFARATSHDLKAPLRGIATLATWIEEDLQGGDRLPPETAERLALLRGRVTRMEALIQGILEYSRVGRMAAEIETVRLSDLLREVVEMLAPPDSILIETQGVLPTIETKRVRLQQILSNLIGNAIKYHDKEQGKIVVRVKPDGDWLHFDVADDGPGIAERFHDKVFLIFQTLQPRDVMESAGVGLALVKKIIEGEGGSISLESEVGKGAVFRFSWPMAPRRWPRYQNSLREDQEPDEDLVDGKQRYEEGEGIYAG